MRILLVLTNTFRTGTSTVFRAIVPVANDIILAEEKLSALSHELDYF